MTTADRIRQDYKDCRSEGYGIAESIRTAVSLNPEMTKAEAVAALALDNVNPVTVRLQFAKSRSIDAALAAELS